VPALRRQTRHRQAEAAGTIDFVCDAGTTAGVGRGHRVEAGTAAEPALALRAGRVPVPFGAALYVA